MNITIKNVTVYPNRARIMAEGSAELSLGLQRLLIDDLPLTMQVDSLRTGGSGTAKVRILGVDVKRVNYVQTPSARARELEAEIEAAQEKQRVVADETAALQAQLHHLELLSENTDAFARGLARGRYTLEAHQALMTHIKAQGTAIRTNLREQATQARDLTRQLKKLHNDLKLLQSQRARQRYQAEIEIDVLAAGVFEAQLSYVVNGAGWQPLYDVRLKRQAADWQLDMTMLAEIKQTTGQDWSGVALAVSTARPALTQQKPKLRPWFIDEMRPAQPKVMASRKMKRSRGARPEMDMMMAGAAPESPAHVAEVAVAEAVDNGVSVTFKIDGHTDIPSDGTPRKVTVGIHSLTPQLDYVAVPKLTDAVFRRVCFDNETPSPLLAGSVTLFVGDEYIGRSRLDYAPLGDEIELMLGVEDRITIERKLTRRQVDKRLLRDQRRVAYGYEIEVHNLMTEMAAVEIEDHLPHSRHEGIKVRVDDIRPELAERSDLNLLKWELKLAAAEKKTITINFTVEHPTQLRIVGLGKE